MQQGSKYVCRQSEYKTNLQSLVINLNSFTIKHVFIIHHNKKVLLHFQDIIRVILLFVIQNVVGLSLAPLTLSLETRLKFKIYQIN